LKAGSIQLESRCHSYRKAGGMKGLKSVLKRRIFTSH
jgi:hypothetical protein